MYITHQVLKTGIEKMHISVLDPGVTSQQKLSLSPSWVLKLLDSRPYVISFYVIDALSSCYVR